MNDDFEPVTPLTRREGGSVGEGAVLGTRREGVLGGYVRVNLPPELAARFEVLGEVASGGESDVLLVRRRDDGGRSAALKIYRHGLEPDPEALVLIRALPREHVVEIYDCGRSTAGWWEEQDYIEHGSLAELFNAEGPQLAVERLREVIVELAGALEAVHPVLHRDVKPTNVLVRAVEPLDLVLGDFGLARSTAFTHIVSTVAGSLAYQSPEALDGGASPARDWWAVGMIVAEASTGRHPFFDPGLGWPPAAEMRIALTTRPVPLDGIDDERIRLLCRGLLIRDPRQRWGATEVRSWLDGGTPTIADESATLHVDGRAAAIQPFVFAGQRCTTPEQLAPLLAQHWDYALRLISGAASEAPDYVRLVGWLEDHHHVPALRVLEQGVKDRSVARRLFRLLRTLDPDLPPSFRGHVVDREGLLALADAAAGGSAEEQLVIYDICELGIVGELAREEAFDDLIGLDERWRAEVELVPSLRDQLGSLGGPLETEETRRAVRARVLLALLDTDAMQSLRDSVGDANQPALTRDADARSLFQRICGDGTQPVRLIASTLALEPARERYENDLEQFRVARSTREDARVRLGSATDAVERGLKSVGGTGEHVLRSDARRMCEAVEDLMSQIDAIPDDMDNALAALGRIQALRSDAMELEQEAGQWEQDPLGATLARRPELVADCEAVGVPDLRRSCAAVLERGQFLAQSRTLWTTYIEAVAIARAVGVHPHRKLPAAPPGDNAVEVLKWCVSVRTEGRALVDDLLKRVSDQTPTHGSTESPASVSPAFGAVVAFLGVFGILCAIGFGTLAYPVLGLWIILCPLSAKMTYSRLKKSRTEQLARYTAQARVTYEQECESVNQAQSGLRAALQTLGSQGDSNATGEGSHPPAGGEAAPAREVVARPAMIMTSAGAIGLELTSVRSQGADVFAHLAQSGSYNGATVRRVRGGSAVAVGGRSDSGSDTEVTYLGPTTGGGLPFARGEVVLIRATGDQRAAELFIVTAQQSELAMAPEYERIGRVTSGMFICDRISDGASEAHIESIHVASA